MADQLFGVLREVVADREGIPVSAPSKLFTAPMRAGLDGPTGICCPARRCRATTRALGYLATITAADTGRLIAQLRAAPQRTVEVTCGSPRR